MGLLMCADGAAGLVYRTLGHSVHVSVWRDPFSALILSCKVVRAPRTG